jgi:ubiquinone/menaquinone biosynthesis C-methylase UbiE
MGWRDKRKIMHSYDVTADIYDERYSEEQARKYSKALENVNLTTKSILDVGCGSGLFFIQVAKKANIVVGIDLSRKLLIKAKKHAKTLQNAFILQADADYLPFKDNLFENVFSFTVLQNMPNPPQTLLEVERVCKKDGWVVATGLKKAFPLEKFMDILEGSGLRIVAFVDEETINCYFAILTRDG